MKWASTVSGQDKAAIEETIFDHPCPIRQRHDVLALKAGRRFTYTMEGASNCRKSMPTRSCWMSLLMTYRRPPASKNISVDQQPANSHQDVVGDSVDPEKLEDMFLCGERYFEVKYLLRSHLPVGPLDGGGAAAGNT